MLSTEVYTHTAVEWNGDEVPVTEEVFIDYNNRYIPDTHIFQINDNKSLRKSSIRKVYKRKTGLKKARSENSKRIAWEKEYDRQRAIAEKWKLKNKGEWEQALQDALIFIKDDPKWKSFDMFNKDMQDRIIEFEARQLCGLKIQVS